MDMKTGEMSGKCPFTGDGGVRSLLGRTNSDWWPQTLNLEFLSQGGASPDPMGDDFDYCEAFNALDYNALRSEEHTSELQSLMRISYAVFCLNKKNSKLKNTKARQRIHNERI